MPLHTDFRPKSFDEIVGNEVVVNGLRSLLTNDSPNRSILIHGPAGCGKTTLARIMAAEIGASPLDYEAISADYHELNASDFRGIDMIRDIRKTSQYQPLGPARVWVLDECHKLSTDAQEAILKLLEHPPSGNWFILCTTEPTKLKITIRRRCAEFSVEPLTPAQIRKLLIKVLSDAEIEVPKEILPPISKECGGSPGLALSILDRVYALPEEQMEKAIKIAAERDDKIIQLCRALMDLRRGANDFSWVEIAEIVKELDNDDPETIRRIVLEYYRKVLLSGREDAFLILDAFSEPFYNTGKAGLALACYSAFVAATD